MSVSLDDASDRQAYYLLGKNLFGSGNFVRCSRSALTLHAIATTPNMTAPMIAVFALQFLGCAYQPPAGDHTCFGYLSSHCWRLPLQFATCRLTVSYRHLRHVRWPLLRSAPLLHPWSMTTSDDVRVCLTSCSAAIQGSRAR